MWLLVLVAAGCAAAGKTPVVIATAETEPVRNGDDAADDPAIWVNLADPLASLIVGTDKNMSLNVYRLDGALLSSREIGPVNNVDIRTIRAQDGRERIIVGASHKRVGRIEVYEMDTSTGALDGVLREPVRARQESTTYGFCFYQEPGSGELHAIATDQSGSIEQWRLVGNADGTLSGRFLRKLRVETQPEGCAVDDVNGWLFVGEEDVGIWRFAVDPDGDEQGVLIARTGYNRKKDSVIAADVEGIDIYEAPSGDPAEGYLVASSQGNSTFVVFDRSPPHAFRGRFRIATATERVRDSDGIDVSSEALGSDYPRGLLVVQDGDNRNPDGSRANQNFKLVSWASVASALELE